MLFFASRTQKDFVSQLILLFLFFMSFFGRFRFFLSVFEWHPLLRSCGLVFCIPFMSSHLEFPTFKQDVFMLAGSTFHHLYSYPSTGSVPAGHFAHAGTHGKHTKASFRNRFTQTWSCEMLNGFQINICEADTINAARKIHNFHHVKH